VVHTEVEWSRRLESSDDRAKHRLKSWAGIDIIFQYNCIKTTRYNPFQQSSFIRVPLQQITTRGSGTRAPRVGRQGQVYTTSVLKKKRTITSQPRPVPRSPLRLASLSPAAGIIPSHLPCARSRLFCPLPRPDPCSPPDPREARAGRAPSGLRYVRMAGPAIPLRLRCQALAN
jgi:hypothetical protein